MCAAKMPRLHPLRRRSCAARLALACLTALLALPQAALAGTYVVNSLADDLSVGTLRWAISQANQDGEVSNTINFVLPGSSTIQLLSALPQIDVNVQMNGAAAVGLRIVGDGTAPVFDLDRNLTLLLDDVVTQAGDLLLSNGTSLNIRRPTSAQTLADAIVGAGGFTKSGTQDLTLTGANTYTGGTTVAEGMLIVDVDSLPGNATIDAGAALVVDQATNGIFTGTTSGDGAFIKRGSAGLLVFGSLNHLGGTRVEEGSLVGSTSNLQGDIELFGTELIFFQQLDGTFNGEILGNGTVSKISDATLTFDSDQTGSGQSFDLDIQGGAVELLSGAALPGAVDVQSGTRLFGTGSIGGALNVSGRLEPDTASSMAALSVGGALTFNAGSTYAVTLTGTDQVGSRTDAAGVITIAGGTLAINATGGDYLNARDFTILSSGVRIDGDFPNVVNNQPFLQIQIAKDTAQQNLTVTLQTLINSVSQAVTRNQASVGIALDEAMAVGNTTPDMVRVREAFLLLPAGAIPPTLDMIGGDMLSAFESIRLSNADRFSRAISDRFTANRYELRRDAPRSNVVPRLGGIGPASFDAFASLGGFSAPSTRFGASSLTNPVPFAFGPGRGESGFGGWVDGFGLFTRLDGTKGARGIDANLAGTSAGIDYRLPIDPDDLGSGSLRVGGAFGYTRSNMTSNPTPAEGTGNTYQGAVYAGYALSRLYVGAMGRFGYTDMETNRRIAFSTIDRVADGSFDGMEASGYIEVGGLIGAPLEVALRPLAAFQYTYLDQSSFNETGAGSLNLQVASESTVSMQTNLGLELSKVYEFDPTIFGGGPKGEFGVEPAMRLGWLHEFGDRARHVDARISGGLTGAFYRVDGAESRRDSFYAGIGYAMRVNRTFLVGMDYDIRFDADRVDHLLRATLNFAW
jgi:autotransporter-associated beta strand protein